MPLPGNRLGPRVSAGYVSDSGQQLRYKSDETLIAALTSSLPVDPASNGFPRGFKPRGVYLKSTTSDARKFIIVGDADDAVYGDAPVNVTIDTEVFVTTGRRGESYTYL